MRVRLDRFEAAIRSVQTRSLIGFIAGGIGLVFFGFVTFLGFLMFLLPDAEGGSLWERRGGFFLGFFLGFVPLVISGLAVVWGVRRRSQMRRLGELAAVARQTSWLTGAHVAQALGIAPLMAERLIVEASGLGFIEEGAPPAPPPARPSSDPAAHAATMEGPPVAIGPGAVLGAYRIEEPLGQGGMGAVFAARHLRTGRRYALKTILAGTNANEATLRRFEREATAASALGHPGLVQVHDFDRAPGGVFYLVMDLLEGETLEARMARTGVLPWRDAQRIALELCDALAAAHDHGLVHRDIKPSNVFLAKGGRPTMRERTVLVDFGLMKSLDASGVTSTGVVIGTPMYMSPEQARGEALDVRSDLYSLAAVIFEMTTGAPPFKDRTLASVYARLLNEPAPLASQASSRRSPPALDAVLTRALAKNREGRFPDARALSAALAGVDAEAAPATVRLA